MVIKNMTRTALQSFLNSLSLGRIVTGRVGHCCDLCGNLIPAGDEHRARGNKRVHPICFTAARERK